MWLVVAASLVIAAFTEHSSMVQTGGLGTISDHAAAMAATDSGPGAILASPGAGNYQSGMLAYTSAAASEQAQVCKPHMAQAPPLLRWPGVCVSAAVWRCASLG